MTNSNRAWTKWGSSDPYYGVLSTEEFRKERLTPEALDKFFATGEKHVEQIFATMRSKVDPNFSPRFALDYGCGTGRLVIPFSRRCEKVLGIDISPAMLQEARHNCKNFDRTNVELKILAEGLNNLPSIDFVHSFITFQHIPASTGLRTIRRLLGALSTGGYLALHVTFGRNASRLRKAVFWARHHIPGAHSTAQILLRRPIADPPMQMNHYPLNALMKSLHDCGVRSVYLEITEHADFLGVIVYGQKSASSA